MYECMALANPCFLRRCVAIAGRNVDKGEHFEQDRHHKLMQYIEEKLNFLVGMKRLTNELKHQMIDELGKYCHVAQACEWEKIKVFIDRVRNVEEFWRE